MLKMPLSPNLWQAELTFSHNKLLRPVGPLQVDFVKDWTAAASPLSQRPTFGQSDCDTPAT